MSLDPKRPRALIQLGANVVPLDEPAYVFQHMVDGWVDQQLSRGLRENTVRPRVRILQRFQEFCGTYPWEWRPGDLEEFTVSAMSGARANTKATIRGYQITIRLFCEYLIDASYGWTATCDARFGAAPQQICSDWNTIAHLVEYEGRPQRRALSSDELERFFDAADARVDSIIRAGKKGSFAALRDTQIFKTIYAYGLRRAEVVGLDIADLRPNASAPRFGTYGALNVRWGKGTRGSGPRRRTVLTVPEFDWAVEGLAQWAEVARSRMLGDWEMETLWPTERRTRVSVRYLDLRFAELREQVGLPPELTLHALRHTYVTNLIEWGYSEKFVQDQVGHAYASTTAIYTSVGDDYKNRVLAQALSRIYGEQSEH
ncbi:tyrosine-type recombinase/integrase [Microbacterium sp. HA-8]|uniref:tyrosine-type recombinase/integrase n=1 Tax=Microbacterium sp. HA-8 TaxID=3234200 RepID=UPI0038F72B6A